MSTDDDEGRRPASREQGTGRAGLSTLLLALQFTDSSFPSGMYTLSHGLEGLRGRVLSDPPGR